MRELVFEGSDRKRTENQNDLFGVELCGEVSGGQIKVAQKIHEMMTHGIKFYSIEFFPQREAQLTETLQSSWSGCEPPLFCAVTWHVPTPLPASFPDVPALRLGGALAGRWPVLLHLAAARLTQVDVRRVLRRALQQGISSLMLLRGDAGEECCGGCFSHAVHLVKFVRQEFGSMFSVFVAGYPDTHPQAASYLQDLQHLKEKVDAGADGIITQVVFEAKKFASFVQDCRNVGISVPILPGIMPIVNFRTLERASRICKFNVPCEITEDLRAIAEDDGAVQEYGLRHATRLVKELFSLDCVDGVHFFSMNRPQVAVAVWQRLGLADAVPSPPPPTLPADAQSSTVPSTVGKIVSANNDISVEARK